MTTEQRKLVLKTLLAFARLATWVPPLIYVGLFAYVALIGELHTVTPDEYGEMLLFVCWPVPIGIVLYWTRAFVSAGGAK